tara:strand:+ start:98 stop:1927 length:1830 start_codon:yes stop_codon:yes gene_type:complete
MNETTTFTIGAGGTESTSVVDGVSTTTGSINIPTNTTALAYTVRFLADSGYHYNQVPAYILNSSDSASWNVVPGSENYNAYGQLKDITFSFYYSMGEEEVPLSLGEQVRWLDRVIEADIIKYTTVESINYVDFKSEDIIPSFDNTYTLVVSGSENATYELKVEDSNGLTYDFSNEIFNRSLTVLKNQAIPERRISVLDGNKPGSNTHDIFIPSFFEGQAYDYNVTTTLIPTGSTKTSTSGTSDPLVIKLNQFGNISLSLTTSTATNGETAADTSVFAFSNKKPLERLFTHFDYSQILSYTTTDTTASGFSGTTMTMSTSYIAKKVQVGDTVSHANISDGTRVSAVNVGGDAVVYTLNQAPASAVSGGQTITFTRNVGISRQPTKNDIKITSPATSYSGLTNIISYPLNASAQNNVIELSSTPEDVEVGMLLQGDSIVGFPKVVSLAGRNIVISSKQNLSTGDIVSFSFAGAKITVEDINVSGSGTGTAKLNVKGYVDNVGIADIAAEVVLDNFLESFVSNNLIAVATTASCSLGGSVVITPLDVNSSSTGELTIASIPSSGSGTTSLSTDSKSIKYKAPTVGTTDTITYTINDGISTSAAANIVITLTP